MRNVLLSTLLIATLLPTLSPWGTIAYYHLNHDYIARVLCENRDKPQLHCDGKCYLAKKLKAQQDKQDKETTRRVENTPVLHLFCQDNVPFRFATLAIGRPLAVHPDYLLNAYTAPRFGLLHPPQV